eukprot:m.18667 g.18667  ORF g.18667 m.18667 type:complete len:175 (+) comp4992_c1_seq2:173-697(+)
MKNYYKSQLERFKNANLFSRVVDNGYLSKFPDGSQANLYDSSGEIPFHVDAPSIGKTICMFNLISQSPMDLIPCSDPEPSMNSWTLSDVLQHKGCRVLLPARSLLVLNDNARETWSHRVPNDTSFLINNTQYSRSERISFVFWVQRETTGRARTVGLGVESGRITLSKRPPRRR